MARGRVYRRRKPNGTWSNWIAVIDQPKGASGARRQVTRTFTNQAEGHRWLAEMSLAAPAPGRTGQQPAILVGAYLTEWLDGQVYLRPSTRASYRMHLDRYLIPAFGDTWITALAPVEVERFVHELAARGLSAGSVNRIIATLRSALARAVRMGLLASSPVVGVRVPSTVARPIRTWTPDEAARFLDALPGDGLGILLRLLLVTGMRRGEGLALRWTAVSLPAAQLRVEVSRVAVGSRVVEGLPKSRAGTRTVFLDASTVAHLSRWKAVQGRVHSYVATDTDGQPLVPWRVSQAFRDRAEALALPAIRLHDLRHTSATLGLAAGESLKEVSVRLGHADITITATAYADVQPATARTSASRRAALMGSLWPVALEGEGGAA